MSTSPDESTRAGDQQVLTGIGVSPGRASGVLVAMPDALPEPPVGASLGATDDADAAAERIAAASAAVRRDLEQAATRASGTGREILETTAMMAADPTLVKAAQRLVRTDRIDPARAVWQAASVVIDQLKSLGGYMAERTGDVADVRGRIVAVLTGRPAPGVPDPGHPFVLLAVDLAPADTATLDPARVVAIITSEGGPTSHTAIIARSLGIPAVVGAAGVTSLTAGTLVLVDGAAGTVTLDPTDAQLARAAELAARVRTFDGTGRTSDGHLVPLLANIGKPAGAQAAADAGAEGVGLFRTEFCFLDRAQAPTIDEQVEQYRQVLAAFAGKKVVVRTLDAGADKPLPFLTNTDEPNPALGVRGLRTSTRNPEILDDQLTAIARAAEAESADVWVMAPMVSTVAETEEFVGRCHAHGLMTAGVMVEVPSAALQSGPILARAQFASIGTNDLTQYAMAADRLLGDLAVLSTSWQPAVLQLIAATCRGGAQQGRPVGVCGEAAADPALAVVLVGLGVATLSMSTPALPDVAAVLASVSADECRQLAELALTAESADGARAAVRAHLPVLDELGL
ncbi:phosphoenolpyruvate--protein phosphotransferase [Pengzhenrongella frigida]|uniref:Phosphoenolpyruvate-protein phosphotransferase n=1 Tax=Pengzhenrongella frigida TaxID=1259133 RepID=A0A4Q5N2K4_9MICO|nr:phosphoenolpyruvate--protein phosphotransferase [Cellulomonas sp. HLT2-17]RYV52370.1 phosphoenolpyruvate--protein phosphotransferase [Cellulomonas sp. HLT2-17]